MSGADPLHEPTSAGLPRDPGRAPEQGTARVESRLTGGREADTGSQQDSEGAVDHAADLAREGWDRTRDRAEDVYDEVRDRAAEWSDRAGEAASRARHEIGDAFDRVGDRLEARTGAVSFVRDNPLLAAGLAFGAGFLLAGDSGRSRSGLMGRARGSLRSAVVGGVSTMLMQELQELMDEHGGPIGLLEELTGHGGRGE